MDDLCVMQGQFGKNDEEAVTNGARRLSAGYMTLVQRRKMTGSQNPLFLLQTQRWDEGGQDSHWHTERVFIWREEAVAHVVARAHGWGVEGVDWRIIVGAAGGELCNRLEVRDDL